MSCRHPRSVRIYKDGGYTCTRCDHFVSREAIRRGKTARLYGISAELRAARKYGGRKTNDGGPVDITGKDWDVQMRTRRTAPPAEWTKAFAIMPGKKLRRLLISYVQGPGKPPIDYYVVPAEDFLTWYGKDGDPE